MASKRELLRQKNQIFKEIIHENAPSIIDEQIDKIVKEEEVKSKAPSASDEKASNPAQNEIVEEVPTKNIKRQNKANNELVATSFTICIENYNFLNWYSRMHQISKKDYVEKLLKREMKNNPLTKEKPDFSMMETRTRGNTKVLSIHLSNESVEYLKKKSASKAMASSAFLDDIITVERKKV